jgi:hypothetical protein
MFQIRTAILQISIAGNQYVRSRDADIQGAYIQIRGNCGWQCRNNTEVIGSKWPIQPNILYADRMTIEAILAEIDSEIARLTEARRLLGTADSARSTSSKRGPKKSAGKARKTRVLSADARKRIADAQKRRWAAQKSKSKKDA